MADVFGLGVEFFGLGAGVEDAQRFGIHATAGTPLPAAIVGRQIAIHQALHEGPLPPAPVADQILHQEGGHDHAAAVVHPAAGIQLSHGCIHDREAGEAVAPGLKPFGVVFPGKLPPERPVGAVGQFREMEQGLLIKLPPGQFLLPNTDCLQRLLPPRHAAGLLGRGPGLPGAEGAERQGGAEGGGAGLGGKIAPGLIAEQWNVACSAMAKIL